MHSAHLLFDPQPLFSYILFNKTAAQNTSISTQLPDVSSWNTKLITEIKYDIIKLDPSVLFSVTGAVQRVRWFWLWPEQVFSSRGRFRSDAAPSLPLLECHQRFKASPQKKKIIIIIICPEKNLPQSYLIGISRIMSRGKIIFMYGIGYMPNVHSTSSCIICRKVK